jgi:hypothetical protein
MSVGGRRMPALIITILTPIGAWIHLRRDSVPRSRARTLEYRLHAEAAAVLQRRTGTAPAGTRP